MPIINIGRRPENHLMIDDPRVSRFHAQIRASKGSFILFDLNSTGGTSVNSQPVTQRMLSPGDVISLAGVPLIYSQDTPESDTGATAALPAEPRPGGTPQKG
jgi:pSer/pThr/pTyr-binding forkhead associated (FHA) protein